jgi:hypothetical protein
MAGPLNATVVLARCSKTKKCFGIRVEQRGKDWIRTWAFPIDEYKAKHEGFDKNKVNLSGVDKDYPGCPHCGNEGFGKCTCDKIGCLGGMQNIEAFRKGKAEDYSCPWCGNTCKMELAESIDVSSGGY